MDRVEHNASTPPVEPSLWKFNRVPGSTTQWKFKWVPGSTTQWTPLGGTPLVEVPLN